ncbi:putative membrane-bound dehydrogenase domain-containing protein [Catalinimonas alkaloidigena]|uniref:Putative membrane-bound dehydrogenase domain-containing protein n=1 Tax=Catalinimonas alkaloidigena TaxID=1075417 RepID=A0A1G9TL63_9BACT|nr:PVC-type heme-binding CxxCH protein [Catalinimonas alkaloidigena]SDM48413.1 putative membrane-bound dehydrogenase domain-containing protein [Catalinimonas alkaloidigena]
MYFHHFLRPAFGVRCLFFLLLGGAMLTCQAPKQASHGSDGPRPLSLLFLGHHSEHHHAEAYMPMLASSLIKQGIQLTYTADPDDLNDENLARYDGLIVYANHDSITTSQEKALLDFVAGGKGFIPIHCASFCFRNSPSYVALVGAQFQRHDTGTFVADIVEAAHPALQGVEEFETWDETYVHHMFSDDRTVLMERVEGDHHEPWTWVKTHGKGRVFYTAYGHDERTWGHPMFQQLILSGIVWAVGDEARARWQPYADSLPTLTYSPAENIPNYEKRDPAPQLQAPLSPEASKKLTQVPPGFSLELFAAEPDIVNPIAMAWDARGRLWVIETVDYPNDKRDGDVGDDRIKICEDTDGDGRADRFTVFAEGLNVPTSLVFAHGGVVVAQAPHFLFLQDTDGDDRADVREVLMDGWGTFDTHAGPSNLRYGFDNQIWGTVGYAGFEGTVAGKARQFRQGVYRFALSGETPQVSSFELVTRTSNNTWGLGFNENFEVFASTANNTHSVYVGIPDRYYGEDQALSTPTTRESGRRPERAPILGSRKIDGHYAMHPLTQLVRQVDVFGGFTAAAGHSFYTARTFPSDYWNQSAFVCEPTGHVLHRARIEPDGAGFQEQDGWNMLASADEWFAPVAAEVGPDGQLWVLDWYNFIIQHNPTPTPERGGFQAENGKGNAYVNPLRDQTHGRIWRLVYEAGTPSDMPQLHQDDADGLVAALENENLFWRLTAQRLLVERGKTDVVANLSALVEKASPDALGLAPAAIHALWTLHGLGALQGDQSDALQVAVKALRHPSAGVRKAALQVLPLTEAATQAVLDARLTDDPDPIVRREAALALSRRSESPQVAATLRQLPDSAATDDYWLKQAYALAHRGGAGTEVTADASVGTAPQADAQVIRIKVLKGEMKYDLQHFEVEAGKPVELVFENPDFMQHNLLVLQPGSLQKVGEAADKLAADPNGAAQNYVPQLPEVLHATPLVDPQQTVTLRFTAPAKTGTYPYVCTFPGHWRIMQGDMQVVTTLSSHP